MTELLDAYKEALVWASGQRSHTNSVRGLPDVAVQDAQAIAILDGMEAIKQYIAYKLLQEGPPKTDS